MVGGSIQGGSGRLEGAYKELQGAVFNADAARNSAQDYCSSSKTLKQQKQNTEAAAAEEH